MADRNCPCLTNDARLLLISSCPQLLSAHWTDVVVKSLAFEAASAAAGTAASAGGINGAADAGGSTRLDVFANHLLHSASLLHALCLQHLRWGEGLNATSATAASSQLVHCNDQCCSLLLQRWLWLIHPAVDLHLRRPLCHLRRRDWCLDNLCAHELGHPPPPVDAGASRTTLWASCSSSRCAPASATVCSTTGKLQHGASELTGL